MSYDNQRPITIPEGCYHLTVVAALFNTLLSLVLLTILDGVFKQYKKCDEKTLRETETPLGR